ncbi:hypothetical protein, partial [Arthrobacter bambusae]|uniref:hypothetical protein n=1 Tax=Arthrobacter bambusae TaxID=1338426 RepID=UPI0027D7AF12
MKRKDQLGSCVELDYPASQSKWYQLSASTSSAWSRFGSSLRRVQSAVVKFLRQFRCLFWLGGQGFLDAGVVVCVGG